MKPKKICSHAGCNTLIDFDQKFCSKHTDVSKWRMSYEGKYRQFYKSKRWIRESKQFLITNCVCVKCLDEGIIKKADVVDHIVPLKADWSKRFDHNNWQALCHRHHGEKTGAEQRARTNSPTSFRGGYLTNA